jgi:hypothetical protein
VLITKVLLRFFEVPLHESPELRVGLSGEGALQHDKAELKDIEDLIVRVLVINEVLDEPIADQIDR